MNRRLTRLRALLVRAGFALGRLAPVRRRVVLATSHADRLGGNLAEVQRGLTTRAPRIPVVVLARQVRRGLLGALRAAVDSTVAGWHLATARVFIVDDYYFPMYAIRPRPGTMRIQTWHACGAFKRFGYSVVDREFGTAEDGAGSLGIHTNYDLCLVSAAPFAPFYAEAFRQPLERFTSRLGIPRTDLFFDEPRMASAAAAIRRRYGIDERRTVVLYAPTFRGPRITEARSPDQLDLVALASLLGEDHVVLFRAHPFVAPRPAAGREVRGVIDVSDWPELNELMLVSDILVTDYSSAIYEFALLGRPIAFFAPDFAAFEAERGSYMDFQREAPGPIFVTTEALGAYLRAGTFDLERVRAFRDASFEVADGESTRRLIDEAIAPALR